MKTILRVLLEIAATPMYAIADLVLDTPGALVGLGVSLGLLAASC